MFLKLSRLPAPAKRLLPHRCLEKTPSRVAGFSTPLNATVPHSTVLLWRATCSSTPSEPKASASPSTRRRNMSANAQEFASDVARAAVAFSDLIGPIPDPSFTLIQLPEGTLRDF